MNILPNDKDSAQHILNMHPHAWSPPTDVYETEESIIVRVEVAGMRDDDFSIELNVRVLSIRGHRQDPAERRAFHQMEIPFGEFHLELMLPSQIEPGQIEATYTQGFLRINLPKAQPRQIPIGE